MLKLILLLTFGLIYLSEGYVLTKTFDQPANRIVGGQNATEGAIPYQASLRSILNSHFCGGSIIADRWVLTAAHCTSGQWKYFIMVVVGTNHLSSGGDRYAVNQIIVHENYDKEVIKNDISVVKVSRPFVYKDSVQPIQIPYEDTDGGANLILTGWGRLSYPGDLPDQLQIISLTALSVEDCEEIYNGNSTDTPAVNGTQICSFTKAGEGACHGDSGGPLVEGDRVVGVVSWGVPCAQGYPDVYTRVYAYRTWILDHINES